MSHLFYKIFFIVIYSICLQSNSFSQTDTMNNRGIELDKTGPIQKGKTYAIVYGVSDYEYTEAIPQLRYADNDARDFYNFLMTTKLVNDSNNIFLRIDQDAKASTFFNDFGKILQRLKEGDQVIVYFAGHGDVEKNGVSVGYLLGYSCAGGTYAGGDVIDLETLQKFVNRAIELKAKVMLVTDACRPGNLPGGDDGRSQTLAYLKSQFVNTTKILSCNQGELSKEMIFPSSGGHGVFTYFLLEAMQGMAVKETEEYITLYDIKKYIADSVRTYTGKKQNPVVIGDDNEPIVKLDKELRAAIVAQRNRILPSNDVAFRSINKKTYDLSPKDSLLFKKFYDQLKNGNLHKPSGDNAFETFKKARTVLTNKDVIYDMKTDLAAKLEDAVQPLMNKFIRGQFQDYPDSLFDEANNRLKIVQDDLMDSTDFRYNEIKAKRIFFIASVHNTPRALLLLHVADSLMPNTAFINFEIGRHYTEEQEFADSALKYLNKSILLSPRWSYPRFMIGNIYYHKKEYNRARIFYDQAINLQPNFVYALFNLALTYKQLKQKDSANYYFQKAVAIDKTLENEWESERKTENEIVSLGKSIRKTEVDEELVFAGLLPPELDNAKQDISNEAKEGYNYYSKAYYQNLNGKIDSARYNYQLAAKSFEKAYQNKTFPLSYFATWGYIYQELKMNDKAKEIYELALKIDTTDFDLYSFGIAWIEDKNGKTTEAMEWYKKAIAYNPNYYKAHNNLGWGFARQKDNDSAVYYYHQALYLNPYFTITINNLANIYFDDFNDDSAIYYYKELLPLLETPSASTYNRIGISYDYTGRYDSAIVYFSKAVNIDSKEAVFKKNLADAYYHNKDYKKAAEYYESANLLSADSAKVTLDLALSYAYINNFKKAEEILKRSITNNKKEKNQYLLYYNLGWVFDKQKKLNEALFWYRKCVNDNPTYANGLNNLGYTYDRLGKSDSAIIWFRQAVTTNPTYTRSLYNLALVYNDLYKYDSSLFYYKKLYTLVPDDASVSYEIGSSYYYDYNYDSAAFYLDNAVRLKKENALYWAKAGDNYFDMATINNNDPDTYIKAINHFKEAIRLDSTQYLALNRLGVSYIYLNRLKEATEIYKLALQKDAIYKNTYEYNLACIYSLQKEIDKAIDYFNRSLESGYNNLAHIEEDTDLDNIRTNPAFKKIIEKFFKEAEINKYPRLYGN